MASTSTAVAVVAFVAIAALASVVFAEDPNNPGTPQGFAGVNEIFIHVVNSTSGRAIAGEAVLAGPVSSPADLVSTIDGVTTASECVHGVPNGSAVFPSSGVVVSNGSTSTFGPCPIKEYYTNSAGWVTVPNQSATYFLIEPGTLFEGGYNAQVITVRGSQTYVTAPYPTGNFTVSTTR